MAISIDWPSGVIAVPKSYLTLISGTLYELDTEQFREDLRALEDDEQGITYTKTHDHNTTYTVAGITYSRAIIILFPYTVTFEDGAYSVLLSGSNNNIFEPGIINYNSVQVISQNSAGLIVHTSGSGVTEQDKDDIRDRILSDSTSFDGADIDTIKSKTDNLPTDPADQSLVEAAIVAATSGLAPSGEYDTELDFLVKVVSNKKVLEKTGSTWYLIIYDNNGVDEILNKAVRDKDGNDITDLAAGVLAQELANSV